MRDISTKNNLLCNFFRLVLHTGAGASLGTDLSSGSQCDLGQRGPASSYTSTENSTTLRTMWPSESWAAVAAMPSATPACGSRVMPRYFWISSLQRARDQRKGRTKRKNEKEKRSAARKNAYTSNILSAQTKSNRNMETRQRAPVGQIKETPSVIAARCHPFPFWHFRATSPGRGSLSHGGRLWREGEVFHSAKGSLFEGAGTA